MAGMPKEVGFHEMLYLVADYFDTEVITFTRLPYPSTYNSDNQGMKQWLQNHPYGMRVTESRSFSDPELRYFQPVIRVTPELPRYEAGNKSIQGHYISTMSFDVWDRHTPMPWWPGFRAISVHRKLEMKPSDITAGVIMHSVHHGQLMGPYFKYEPQNVAPALRPLYNVGTSYVRDADSDRRALMRWNKASRLRWTAAKPQPGQPLDPLRRPSGTSMPGSARAGFFPGSHRSGSGMQ
ncbi:hypothetical protein CSUB01_11435 [Colletotrichum sublineola]|uniref:Uncharacterized protein n=1 Tax=Colletotrichum sublineola TaxID=1173701 RepID=A0A066XUG8_COLSU|nr:hypothetical protein CSUB01_11435 [Colletotrichum sublineola]